MRNVSSPYDSALFKSLESTCRFAAVLQNGLLRSGKLQDWFLNNFEITEFKMKLVQLYAAIEIHANTREVFVSILGQEEFCPRFFIVRGTMLQPGR